MAGIVPMCDSDEEVFFGPVTAREIELKWRRMKSEKNERGTVEPVADLGTLGSCEQLVPSLELGSNDEANGPKESFADLEVNKFHISFPDRDENVKDLGTTIVGENVTPLSNQESFKFIDDDSVMDVDAESEEVSSALPPIETCNNVHKENGMSSATQGAQNKPPSLNFCSESTVNKNLMSKDFASESIMFEKSDQRTEIFLNSEPVKRHDSTVDHLLEVTSTANIEVSPGEELASLPEQQLKSAEVLHDIELKIDGLDLGNLRTEEKNHSHELISACNTQVPPSEGLASGPEEELTSSEVVHDIELKIDGLDLGNLRTEEKNHSHELISACNNQVPPSEGLASRPEEELTSSEVVHDIELKIDGLDLGNLRTEEKNHSHESITAHNTEVSPSEGLAPGPEEELTSSEVVYDIKLKIDGLDLGNINTEEKVIMKEEKSENKSDSDSSDKSFVSLPPSEEIDYESKELDTSYVPPDKKQCTQPTARRDKENEDPKSRIPVPGGRIPVLTGKLFQSSVLKPAKLKVENIERKVWVPDFKKKKIPPPKKPDYIVSPNKLDRLLKSTPGNKLNRPHTAEGVIKKSPLAPQYSNTQAHQTPLIRSLTKPKPESASKSKLLTPPKIARPGDAKLNTPHKNPIYNNITSPVAEYIKNSRTTIIRNITPSGKPLVMTPKILQEPTATGLKTVPTPKASLPPRYYSSADKRLILESSGNKGPSLPKLGERQAAVLNSSPKCRVIKHLGRIKSEDTGSEHDVEAAEKQTRRTSLSETSFAHLPPSFPTSFDVSLLQEQ